MKTDDASALFFTRLHEIAPEVDVDAVEPDAPLQDAMDSRGKIRPLLVERYGGGF